MAVVAARVLRRHAVVAGAALACIAAVAGAQRVELRLRPHVGDTLHTLLEQRTEMSATMPGNSAAPARSVTTNVAIHSRTIVRAAVPTSTTVLTVVDSASIASNDVHAEQMIADAQRSLHGQQLMLQLAPDGSVQRATDVRTGAVRRDLAEAMGAMPAVLPLQAVKVGDTWDREMPLPPGGPLGARGSGHARATFRLDSLQRNGSLAYVSMKGDIVPDSTSQGVELNGSISGSMLIDRARGWLTDSRFVVMLRALVVPPTASGLAPMRFVTHVTQRLRTMDKR